MSHLGVHGRDHAVLGHPFADLDPALAVRLHVLAGHPLQQGPGRARRRLVGLHRQLLQRQLGARHQPL